MRKLGMDILSYTREVLSRMMIGMEIGRDGEFSNPHIREILGSIQLPEEREVINIVSLFEIRFIMFRLMEEFVFVGPYLTRYLSEADIDEKTLSELGAEKSRIMNIPVISDAGVFRVLMHTLFDTLWGRDNYCWKTVDDRANVSITSLADDIEYFQADEISQRYKAEARLLDAVRRFDMDYIERISSEMAVGSAVEKRNNNPVRNIQNYSIIMNTLLRKTAYDAGVAAVYVDRLSSMFGRRIEKVSTSMAVSHLMKEMLTEYALLIRSYSWDGYPTGIKAVLFTIDSRYRDHLTLEELSRVAGVSPSYLSRLFSKVLGKSLSEYVNEVRITKSLKMLRNPDLSVAYAAVSSGFEDQAYYTRTFRKIKGMTPTEWRKKQGM